MHSNLKIGTRLGILLAIAVGCLLALAAVSVWRLEKVGDETEYMVSVGLANERLMREWVTIIETNTARTYGAAKAVNAEDEKFFQTAIAAYSKRAGEIQGIFEKGLADPVAQGLFKEMLAKRTSYQAARASAFKEKAAGNVDAAARFFDQQMTPAVNAFMSSMQALLDYQQKANGALALRVHEHYEGGRTIIIALSACAILLSIGYSIVLWRSITRPMSDAVALARRVADGDLTSKPSKPTRDETGQMIKALEDMNANLLGIVRDVRSGTDAIASASGEIAAANQDLSSRTEQQASSLQQTAASMEELTSTVR